MPQNIDEEKRKKKSSIRLINWYLHCTREYFNDNFNICPIEHTLNGQRKQTKTNKSDGEICSMIYFHMPNFSK